MSGRAVGFLVSVLVHLGLLLPLTLWFSERIPEPEIARPVALTLAMFERVATPPATEPVPEPVSSETPSPPPEPEVVAVTPDPATAPPQQPAAEPPKPLQTRVIQKAVVEPVTKTTHQPPAPARPEPKPKVKSASPAPPPKPAAPNRTVAERRPAVAPKPKVSEPPASVAALPPAASARSEEPPALAAAELVAMEASYLDGVRQRIEAHKFYPLRARRMHQQGTVVLRLVLLRDGSIGEVSLATSSGTPLLDDAAVEAVRRVAAFPPFPLELARRDWVLTVPVRYSLM